MKYLILVVILFQSTVWSSVCDTSFKCKRHGVYPKFKDNGLTCTLPNMPTMPIKAVDVFESNGNLKNYWGQAKNVCDVLGWLEEGAEKFGEVGEKYSYAKA